MYRKYLRQQNKRFHANDSRVVIDEQAWNITFWNYSSVRRKNLLQEKKQAFNFSVSLVENQNRKTQRKQKQTSRGNKMCCVPTHQHPSSPNGLGKYAIKRETKNYALNGRTRVKWGQQYKSSSKICTYFLGYFQFFITVC
jgi:hypothetical protein